jgi:hypothetical protein
MVAFYVLLLRVHPTHHIRYVLPVYLLLAWSAGKLVGDGLAGGRLTRAATTTGIVAVLTYAVVQGFSIGALYNRDPRYTLEAWLRDNVTSGTTLVAIEPEYALPRFPPGLRVVTRRVWNYNGVQIADIDDVGADLVVLGMSVPRRVEQSDKVLGFLHERGYRLEVDFKSPVPRFGREIPDMHYINPRVAVFRRVAPVADNATTPSVAPASRPTGFGHNVAAPVTTR